MEGRLYSFDLLRGFAAIAVMLYHGGRILPSGYLAVDLFFLLSGFVLAAAYGPRLKTGTQARQLLLERAIRLLPMMIVAAGVGLALNGGSPSVLLLVPQADGGLLYPANIPMWSLLFEVIASVCFILLFRFGMVAWGIVWAAGLYGTILGILDRGSADLGYNGETALFGLARTAFSFSTGMALHWLWRSRSIPSPLWLVALAALAPLAVTIMPRGNPVLDLVAVFGIFPASVFLLALLQLRPGKIAAALGALSFPLYAIHHPILRWAEGASLPILPWLFVLSVTAVAIFYLVDMPLRRWLRNRVETPAVPAVIVKGFHKGVR